MAGHINLLLKQAVTTFSMPAKTNFPKNIEKLKCLLDKTKGSDLGLHSEHDIFKQESWCHPGKAPVTYVQIYDDDAVSVGVFIVAENMKLPLHDHPHMHGLIKVIYGTLKISSYTISECLDDKQVDVECHTPINLHYIDPPCILEPNHQNLHEIESVDGVAAFVDILAPPYDVLIPELGKRKCTYFKRIRQTGVNKMLLESIESPSWFWCDQLPYSGPHIEEDFVLHEKTSEN